MFKKEHIVVIKKGINNHYFDVSDLNLIFPKTGLFVGFEKLLIEKNKIIKIIKNQNTNETKSQVSYAPLVLYDIVEKVASFVFLNGVWIKKIAPENKKMIIYEPVIKLTLSN